MNNYVVRTQDGVEYAVSAYTRRHAVAEALLAMIRDGKVKLLDFDASVVMRWSVELVESEVVARFAAAAAGGREMNKRSYLVRPHTGLKYAAYAYTRRHAVAEALLEMIRDGDVKLLDFDASVVMRWSVELVESKIVAQLAAEVFK